jgi:hypothetical protein
LPEKENETFAERLAQRAILSVLGQTIGNIGKFVEPTVKRWKRTVVLMLSGVVVTVLGVAFLAVGTVKWLAILMPSWLAWMIVRIILLLLGVTLASLAK